MKDLSPILKENKERAIILIEKYFPKTKKIDFQHLYKDGIINQEDIPWVIVCGNDNTIVDCQVKELELDKTYNIVLTLWDGECDELYQGITVEDCISYSANNIYEAIEERIVQKIWVHNQFHKK